MKNNRKTGTFWERVAGKYLEQQGYFILEYNYRCPLGEIDLIASKGEKIVFVEVKYRKSNAFGYAAEAVDQKKQTKIRKTAMYYLTKNYQTMEIDCRFDVMCMDDRHIELLENAF